eukprot:scaffold30331_cov35-Tisochrysis_lutea.AAC.4
MRGRLWGSRPGRGDFARLLPNCHIRCRHILGMVASVCGSSHVQIDVARHCAILLRRCMA